MIGQGFGFAEIFLLAPKDRDAEDEGCAGDAIRIDGEELRAMPIRNQRKVKRELKGTGFSPNRSAQTLVGLHRLRKRLYFAKNPEIRPSVAKANVDLIDLIGTAKAVPLQI